MSGPERVGISWSKCARHALHSSAVDGPSASAHISPFRFQTHAPPGRGAEMPLPGRGRSAPRALSPPYAGTPRRRQSAHSRSQPAAKPATMTKAGEGTAAATITITVTVTVTVAVAVRRRCRLESRGCAR